MSDIKFEIGQLFNTITYPQDKLITPSTIDQYLVGFNEGWNKHREGMFGILTKIYGLLDASAFDEEKKCNERKEISKGGNE